MNVHADILFLNHKGAPFARLACEQPQPIAKVGAFLYCVLWGFCANYGGFPVFKLSTKTNPLLRRTLRLWPQRGLIRSCPRFAQPTTCG
jgi:hypothetical protein